MSFSSSWLALREPADRRSRAPQLLQMLEGYFAGRDYADVVDLGCGTGSTLRTLQNILPRRQSWRLIDNDPALLMAAGDELASWADSAGVHGDSLLLEKNGKSIRVLFLEADLMIDPAPWDEPNPDLVTASALFDLVSIAWIDAIVDALARTRTPLYAGLNYDGRAGWEPEHHADQEILNAFNRHQRSDKGFGASAGPQAAEHLRTRLLAQGFSVEAAGSPWILTEDDRALAAELNSGIAEAVQELHDVNTGTVTDWLETRLRGGETRIGHTDILALPSQQG